MTAPVAPGSRAPLHSPSASRHSPWTTHRTLKTWATLIVAVPAILLGALVAMVEEPPVGLWVLALGAVFVAILVVAWRWPIVGGPLVALLGVWQEWSWFTGPLEGDVQQLVDSLGSVSPLWFTIVAVISGAMFVAAGLLPEREGRP